MRKGILKMAAVSIGLAIAPAACGQSGDGKDSGLDQNESEQNSGLEQSENAEDSGLGQSENVEDSGSEQSESMENSGSEQSEGAEDSGMERAENGEALGLAGLYEDNFPIGVALPGFVFQEMDTYEEAILNNFNSITL